MEYAIKPTSARHVDTKQAAAGQMRIAICLWRDRLPKVGALLAAGEISAKCCLAITWRTRLRSALEDARFNTSPAGIGRLARWERCSARRYQHRRDEFDPTQAGRPQCSSVALSEFGGAEELAAPQESSGGCWPPTPLS